MLNFRQTKNNQNTKLGTIKITVLFYPNRIITLKNSTILTCTLRSYYGLKTRKPQLGLRSMLNSPLCMRVQNFEP